MSLQNSQLQIMLTNMANYANSANAASSKASLLAFQLASSTSFDSETHRKFAMYDADFGRKKDL